MTTQSQEDQERWGRAATWSSGSDELTAMQTLMWRSERHPVQSSTTCVVLDLDRMPDWDRFFAAHEWGTGLVRRLRQRVLEPVAPTAAPTWVEDTAFDLGYHLRLERASGRDEMLANASQLALRPFDTTRPLWEGVLVEMPDAAAYVLKIHHALADPLGAVQLLSMLQSGTRTHTPRKPVAEEAPAAPVDNPIELAVDGFRAEVRALPGQALHATRSLARTWLRPRAALASALHYGASVRRLVSTPAPPSPVLSPRTGKAWRFLTFEAPLDALRSLASQGGGTLDEAAVAVVLGGLGRYHERHGSAAGELPVGVRVSLDRADDLGNRFAAALISGPIWIKDPVDRVAAVRGEVLSLHTERALEALSAASTIMNRLPSWVGATAMSGGASADALVFTLPGPPQRRFMAGAEVQSLNVLGPLPGSALTACLVTYAGTACLGVNVDGSAVADLDVFAECLREEIDALVAAAG